MLFPAVRIFVSSQPTNRPVPYALLTDRVEAMYLKKFSSLLVVMCLSALATNSYASAPPLPPQTRIGAKEAIQNTFSQYRKALLEGDSSRAADMVDARTIALYAQILKEALNMPHEKLSQLDFISKFMLLRVRHEFNRSQI